MVINTDIVGPILKEKVIISLIYLDIFIFDYDTCNLDYKLF